MAGILHSTCESHVDQISSCFIGQKDKQKCPQLISEYFECTQRVGRKLYFSSLVNY